MIANVAMQLAGHSNRIYLYFSDALIITDSVSKRPLKLLLVSFDHLHKTHEY